MSDTIKALRGRGRDPDDLFHLTQSIAPAKRR
jgi:hypothetical protein